MQAKITGTLVCRLQPASKPYEVNDTEFKGFLVRVQPSGTIGYYCTYRGPTGKRNRLSLGRHPIVTAIQARDHARRTLAVVVQGGDPAKARQTRKSDSLRAFVDDEYAPWCATHHKGAGQAVARIKACFPTLLAMPLNELDATKLERWRVKRQATGTAASSINRDLATLKSALSKAVEWGHLAEHPLKTVKLAKLDHGRVVRYLSPAEDRHLLEALEARDERLKQDRDSANLWRGERGYEKLSDLRQRSFADHLTPMVLISKGTGLRRGELFGLRWTDVDLIHANVTVRGDTAKSGKTRHVPLNSNVMNVIKLWRKQSIKKIDLVFPSSTGNQFDNVNKAWSSILRAAQITSFRWHDLRHDFASQLVMAGVGLNDVRELLGHADLKMTLRYAHLSQAHKAAAVERLVQRIS